MARRWRKRRRQTEAAGHPYVNLRRRPTEYWSCGDSRAYRRKSTRAFRCACVSLGSVTVCALLTAWTEAQPRTGTHPLKLSTPTSVFFSWRRVGAGLTPSAQFSAVFVPSKITICVNVTLPQSWFLTYWPQFPQLLQVISQNEQTSTFTGIIFARNASTLLFSKALRLSVAMVTATSRFQPSQSGVSICSEPSTLH